MALVCFIPCLFSASVQTAAKESIQQIKTITSNFLEFRKNNNSKIAPFLHAVVIDIAQ